MIRDLEYYGSPVLRQQAQQVSSITQDIRLLIQDMYETMVYHKGVGLAAPQVGASLSIFVMDVEKETANGDLVFCEFPRVYINPVLSDPAPQNIIGKEGCLSIPKLRGDVYRPKAVTITAQNLDGQLFTERLEGFVARIAMHEVDHLHGILYIDRMEKSRHHKFFKKELERIQKQYSKQ